MGASIEYVERMIATLNEATRANLATPGRQGNIVVLAPELASEVMITGDIHGHRRNFNAIRKTAALEERAGRHLVLQEVCHGGPTYSENGGCMSHSILEDVATMKVRFPESVHFIVGNHELAELTDYPIQKNRQMLNLMFRLGLQQAYGPASEKVREAYCEFIRSCPLAVRLPGGLFISHSIPQSVDGQPFDASIFSRKLDDADWLEQAEIFELVWGRDYRQENAQAFADLVGARLLVNGHEPCSEGFSTPNELQVILDCCGDKACYVIVSTDRTWTQDELVRQIRWLA